MFFQFATLWSYFSQSASIPPLWWLSDGKRTCSDCPSVARAIMKLGHASCLIMYHSSAYITQPLFPMCQKVAQRSLLQFVHLSNIFDIWSLRCRSTLDSSGLGLPVILHILVCSPLPFFGIINPHHQLRLTFTLKTEAIISPKHCSQLEDCKATQPRGSQFVSWK
jgi:hypothetical protein